MYVYCKKSQILQNIANLWLFFVKFTPRNSEFTFSSFKAKTPKTTV